MPHASAPLVLYLALLAWCAASAPWHALRAGTRQHGWLGLTVALLLIWNMPARLGNGMDLHLAGASLAALMFGPRLAAVALGAVFAVVAFNGRIPLPDLALHGLAFMLMPAFLGTALQRAIEAWLPRHVFVFIFVNAFAGTLAANALATLAFVGLSSWMDGPRNGLLAGDFLAYRLLLSWGEAMLTGMLAAVFLAYRPQWLMSFRDERYLTQH